MFEIFINSSATTFLSMLKIFLVMFVAGMLVRKRVLSPEHIKGLTAATVDVFLPCLVFYSVLMNLRPGIFTIWWLLPVSAWILMFTVIGMSALLFARELPEKRNMLSFTAIHNAAYLVLPLGAILFPNDFEQFSLYVFLFLTGQTPVIWSLGKYMTTSSTEARFQWKGALNPPLIASLSALFLVFTGLRDLLIPTVSAQVAGSMPAHVNPVVDVFLATIKLLGDATVPLALFILGGVLGSIRIHLKGIQWDLVRVSVIKFLILPAIMFLILRLTGLANHYPLLASFFMIESAAPPAIVHILQVNRYGGDEQKIGSMLLATYLICLVALPFWVALWKGFNG